MNQESLLGASWHQWCALRVAGTSRHVEGCKYELWAFVTFRFLINWILSDPWTLVKVRVQFFEVTSRAMSSGFKPNNVFLVEHVSQLRRFFHISFSTSWARFCPPAEKIGGLMEGMLGEWQTRQRCSIAVLRFGGYLPPTSSCDARCTKNALCTVTTSSILLPQGCWNIHDRSAWQ